MLAAGDFEGIYLLGPNQGPQRVAGAKPGTTVLAADKSNFAFGDGDQIRIWDTATWLHEMSKTATLHPGDVLWMGTQGADGDMVPGDVIEIEISGIGVLRNYVVAER